jgi:hypothetical protein
LTATYGDAAACSDRAGVKQPHHFSAARRRQLGNGKLARKVNLLREKPKLGAENFNRR